MLLKSKIGILNTFFSETNGLMALFALDFSMVLLQSSILSLLEDMILMNFLWMRLKQHAKIGVDSTVTENLAVSTGLTITKVHKLLQESSDSTDVELLSLSQLNGSRTSFKTSLMNLALSD